MGVFDKIKNALFEEEYVEVEEKPKKSKKELKKREEVKEKPIAKKVVLANKNTSKIEHIKDDEESLEDEIQEEPIVEKKPDFKIMDDDDFKVEEENQFHNNDHERDLDRAPKIRDEEYDNYSSQERVIYRQERIEDKHPYGIDESSRNLVQDYGRAYEKKEEKSGFRPSPIISPIYGVLDKNYKKEDVVQKREVRLTSYSKDSANVDDIRNKAYGSLNENNHKENEEEKKSIIEVEEDDSDLLVDLSTPEKPAIKEVTMGDAMEYFQDLGLEYNVDYKDASKEKATGRRVKEHYEDEEKDDKAFDITEENKEEDIEEKKKEKIKEAKDEFLDEPVLQKFDSTDIDNENGDNLFDLIESMYQEDN